MHSLVRRYLKTGIAFLIVGLAIGLWLMGERELMQRHVSPYAASAHTHAILVGFVVSGALTWLATSATTDAEIARWFALSTAANGLAFPALVLWTAIFAWRLRSAR